MMHQERIDLLFEWDDTVNDIWYNPLWYNEEVEKDESEQTD